MFRHEVYRSVILLHRLPLVQIGMQRDFPAHCKTQSHGKESTPPLTFRPLLLPQISFAFTHSRALYRVRIRATNSGTKHAIDTSA